MKKTRPKEKPHDDLWAAQINADEAGNLLYEATRHLEEIVELLEDDKARRLLGLYLSAKRHLKHESDCKPCAAARLRYAKMRQEPRP